MIQVFLLDYQRVKSDTIVDDERSFIFLLCHHWCNSEIDNQWQKTPERVPYKNIVLGLFVNEMLLQMIGNVLVKGTNKAIPRYLFISMKNILLYYKIILFLQFSKHSSSIVFDFING